MLSSLMRVSLPVHMLHETQRCLFKTSRDFCFVSMDREKVSYRTDVVLSEKLASSWLRFLTDFLLYSNVPSESEQNRYIQFLVRHIHPR